MATSTAYARAAERVERACRAGGDARSLRLALLEAIRRAVPFDSHAWLLTDPETEVGCAPLAEVPCLDELPRLIGLKYRSPVNRWTALATPSATLAGATTDPGEHGLRWMDFLAGQGVTDVASTVFRDRFGCWGFLDLWRTAPAPRFAPAETELLASVTGPITAALRRAQARTFDLAGSAPPRGGPIVLVLSPQLEVRGQTPETEQYLSILVPPGGDRRPIPAVAYNVAAQLLAVEAAIDDHPASARVHLAGGLWLTVRAARMGDTAPAEGGDLAVTIEVASPDERAGVFARAHALTARETELLGHLASGSDTRRIAELMFLSEHTVQDHLKSIFAKTAVRSRRTLLARALGGSAVPA